MRKIPTAAVAMAAFLMPLALHAQFSDSYNFLKAVKDRDGSETTKILGKPGNIVNTHDSSSGETVLHILAHDRDLTWMGFMLAKGAKPDERDNRGDTPLGIATQLNWTEGVELLLKYGASIDLANSNGETPLIIATHNDDVALVRLLLEMGANPDKTDHISGTSARTYARQNTRDPALAEAFTTTRAHARKPQEGPHL